MLNPMLRLSGFPLNPYLNPQMFQPVPNVASLAASGVMPTGTNATASHLQTHIGPNVKDVSKHSKTSKIYSPMLAFHSPMDRTASPKTNNFSSPSSTASAPSVQSPSLAPSFLPKSRSPKTEPSMQNQKENKEVTSEVSPRKRNRKISENSPILDPLEPLEKISRLEHLTSSIGGSRLGSSELSKTANSSSLALKPMKNEVFSVPSSPSSPVLKQQSSEVQAVLPTVQAKPLIDQSEAPETPRLENIKTEKSVGKSVGISMTPKEVQMKDNLSSSEDFSSSEDNEDKNENIKVFKNGVEMTTWHCDVCKCIFLDQVSKITLYMKIQ